MPDADPDRGHEEVRYQVRGSAAWLTIDREERRNALSPAVVARLGDGLRRAAADGAVRVVCLTGAGDKSFCSGADLSEPGAGGRGAVQAYARLLEAMRAFEKPLVARVNGHCLAGGLGPMLCCDMVYARESVRFGLPEVTVGLFPMMVAAFLARDGLRKKVLELVYTGAPATAREAEAMGLVTRVFPDGELDAAVERVLEAIAGNAPRAIRLGRRALAEAEGLPTSRALELLAGRLPEVLATEDAAEGLTAFREKRTTRWKDR